MCVNLITSESQIVRPVQDLKERYVRLQASKQLYKTDEVIQFKFLQEGFLDPKSVHLAFTVTVDAPTAGIQAIPGSGVTPTSLEFTFTNDISNVFSRVRLLFGRTGIVEDIQEYGLLQSLFELVTDKTDDLAETGCLITGKAFLNGQSGSSIANTAHDLINYHNHANTGTVVGLNTARIPRRYTIQVNLGLLTQRKAIPLFLMNDELTIEFTVNKLYNCAFFSNSPVLGIPSCTETPIKIGMPELLYTTKLPTDIDRALAIQNLKKTFSVHYPSFTYVNQKLDPFLATQNLKIPLFNKRILYAIAVIRCENDRRRDVFIQNPNNLYFSLDPRIGRTQSGGNPAWTYREARNTALKSYQWFYNNKAIPEQPVSVIENDQFDSIITYTPTFDQKTGTAAEALHYLRQTLKLGNFGVIGNNIFGLYDAYQTPGVQIGVYNRLSNTATNSTGTELPYQQYRTIISSFMMAGKFYSERENGVLYALDGNDLNATLTLNLQFNKAATVSLEFPSPPPMSVDIFLAYDGVVSINADRSLVIDV